MPNTCNRRLKCNNDKYGNSEKCILHCAKSNFNANDIRLFWEEIRNKHVKYNRNWDISEDIVIEGVIFPCFKDSNRNQTFFVNYNHFSHNVKFIKCVFTDDCDLNRGNSLKKITFEDCVFQGDIKLIASNEMEIVNSEFKREVSLGNPKWNNLHIYDTKFIKDVNLIVKDNLSISNDCIFRGNLKIDGGGSLDVSFENSLCSKQLSIQDTNRINIENVELKSDVNFNSRNSNIEVKNINFVKDVSFDEFHNLSIDDTQFNKKINFTSDNHNEIIISKTTVNDMTLPSFNALSIINDSKINASLTVTGSCQNLNIDNCKISKKLDINDATNVILKGTHIRGSSQLNGLYNDVSITESSFMDLIINTTHTLNVNDISILGRFDLLGDQYESILINNAQITDLLQISKVTKLELKAIKSYPSLKLIHDGYEDVSIKDSEFTDVEIKSIKFLNIFKTTISGMLSLLGEMNDKIIFDTVSLKNRCDFPIVNSLTLNKCRFNKEIDLNKTTAFSSNNTHYKNEVKFLEECATLNFKKCKFYEKIKLSKIANVLEINSCLFKDEVDLSEGEFNIIDILSSSFNNKLLLSSSTIKKISLDTAKEELSDNNTFLSLVDFTNSLIDMIKISNCDFDAALNFMNLKKQINLSDISATKVDSLIISDSLVVDLFRNSYLLQINNFILENSKLDSTATSKEIDINGIKINEFKCNKLVLLKDMNFSEMTINKFRIANTNIEDRVRIKESDIGVFNLISCTFEDLQIIDNISDAEERSRELRLKNTTIKNAVLDKLKYDDFIMNDAHVSEAKIGNVQFKNGSRETNRFFKNYYDSISDYIQANKYYQQEMEEHYKTTSDRWEKFILWVGKIVSGFGQSWGLPVLWMIVFTVIFYRVANFDLLSMDGFRENHISWMINDTLKFVNPFSKSSSMNYGNFYWAWIVHKLFMTIFTYHFIVAIKRKTRR